MKYPNILPSDERIVKIVLVDYYQTRYFKPHIDNDDYAEELLSNYYEKINSILQFNKQQIYLDSEAQYELRRLKRYIGCSLSKSSTSLRTKLINEIKLIKLDLML